MGYYNSFVIRVRANDLGQLQGVVEHAASRDRSLFIAAEAILTFIRSHLGSYPDYTSVTQEHFALEPSALPHDSFIVQIWSGVEEQIRGTVENVISGDHLAFITLEAILTFVNSHLSSYPDAPPGCALPSDGVPGETNGSTIDPCR